jgi:hypothetical protein
LKIHEQHLGFKHQPHGILRNVRLRKHLHPADQFSHDWMHILAVAGILHIVMYECLALFDANGMHWSLVHGFCRLWFFPFAMGSGTANVADVLSPHRVAKYKSQKGKNKTVKCQASRAVSSLPFCNA